MWPWEAFYWGVFWAMVASGIALAALWFVLGALAGLWEEYREREKASIEYRNKLELKRLEQRQRGG
jgi:hypothetical protein